MRRIILAAAALALTIGNPGLATAASNIETAKTWGLLGTWQRNCEAPAGLTNIRYRFVAREGQVIQESIYGSLGDRVSVTGARILDDGSLELRMKGPENTPDGIREVGLVRGEDGRIRTRYSKDIETGKYSVREGRFVETGEPIGWLMSCN